MNLQQDQLVDLQGLLTSLSVKSRSTYYKYAKQHPSFPRPVRMTGGHGPLKFKAREVAAFIDSLRAGE